MALDREKILQAAQKHVDKKKFDKAIQEYQKIIQQDPNDARTLLKIGDLQARMEAYAEAIATYDRVGQFYAAQGFSLKAIAVYKQIRELIKKHVPQLEDRYGHIVPKLAQIYTELGLTSDALSAYDEVATRLQRNGRDRDAIDVFRRMVALDQTNPLPHLRLAEACCRVQSVDEAIDSFWTAAELLIRLKRRDDALKVVERILHFRQEPRYARVAAELYLERGQQQDGLQALAKLQLCFQADPKNLEVLDLLARAFVAIGQAPKAIEVKKEIARLAQEQGRDDVFRNVMAYLERVAPDDQQVRAFARGPMSSRTGATSLPPDDDIELIEGSLPPPSLPAPHSRSPVSQGPQSMDLDVEDFDFDDAPMSIRSLSNPPPEQPAAGSGAPARSMLSSAPDLVVMDEVEAPGLEGADLDLHVNKALADAESFRGLRLYVKAAETLRIALELAPESIDLHERLRDVVSEAGDRDGAIAEMITLGSLYYHAGDPDRAQAELVAVLDAEPEHPGALEMLRQLGLSAVAPNVDYVEYADESYEGTTDLTHDLDSRPYDPNAPLPSFDLEGVSVAEAIEPPPLGRDASPTHEDLLDVDPLSAPEDVDLEQYLEDAAVPPGYEHGQQGHVATPPQAAHSPEAIDDVLEEAEFFAMRGLVEDARTILQDALARSPKHPLLLERLHELDGGSGSGTHEVLSVVPAAGDDVEGNGDRIFDIAASLGALDELAQHTRSSRPPSSLRAVDEIDVDQVFAKFKEGVRAQISDSDSSTHYDLGVAYKEMGLLPDAINEFAIAAQDARFECTCNAMIGMIHLEQGELDRSAEAYIRALSAPQKTIDQEMSLYYDLGNVYEMKRSNAEALYYFQKIARRDPGYRDVKDRIEALKPPTRAEKTPTGVRAIQTDDELEAAFDDLFESK